LNSPAACTKSSKMIKNSPSFSLSMHANLGANACVIST
jgi:hypothetical protein